MLTWIPNLIALKPLHMQLADMISYKVDRREFDGGTVLPAIITLSRISNVPQDVVRTAYEILADRGVIHFDPRIEAFICNEAICC
jgi:DNA-binding transcriptional regulator YhcF (GntR family)